MQWGDFIKLEYRHKRRSMKRKGEVTFDARPTFTRKQARRKCGDDPLVITSSHVRPSGNSQFEADSDVNG